MSVLELRVLTAVWDSSMMIMLVVYAIVVVVFFFCFFFVCCFSRLKSEKSIMHVNCLID